MPNDTQVIEADDALLEKIADKAVDKMKGAFTMPSADEIAESVLAKTEKAVKKDVMETEESIKNEKKLKSGFETLPKEVRFAKAVKASLNNDGQTMAEYNAYVSKAWSEKANYQNVTTASDGGALVPDPEFVAEIERLTDTYGTAARLATIRRTDRDSVTLLSGTNEVSFVSTSEATAQNAQKLTYSSATATLQKYIATLVMTSELVEDSAVDIFADATNEVARARAKLLDQLVFTDATHGLLSAGIGDAYKTIGVGSAITDLHYDDLLGAQYQVTGEARRNGRWFMHPTVYNLIRKLRYDGGGGAGTGDYFIDATGMVNPTIDGIPVEFVDILPASGDVTANEAFAAFGDLSRIKVHIMRLLETKVFDSGVVKDAGGSDVNLITQDAYAMRVTTRLVPQTRFKGAFVIVGTGTVS